MSDWICTERCYVSKLSILFKPGDVINATDAEYLYDIPETNEKKYFKEIIGKSAKKPKEIKKDTKKEVIARVRAKGFDGQLDERMSLSKLRGIEVSLDQNIPIDDPLEED